MLVGTAIDGQLSPPSCWRLSSLSSAGWDGRNDCASDGCYSDGAGAPVLLVERPVAQEDRNTGWRGVLSVSCRAAFAARDLRSLKLGISGKPDCLIRTADGMCRSNLKNRSGHRLEGSYPNHMIQNLAYCALVEEQLRERVPYGLVIYAGQQVRRVEFTDSNRRWLMHTIAALQAARLVKQAKRNHNQRGRCSGCGVRGKWIRLCVENSHRGLSIRHDQMHHSHACFRGSAAIPHASEQTRILPGTGSVEVASDE